MRKLLHVTRWLGVILVVGVAWTLTCDVLSVGAAVGTLVGAVIGSLTVGVMSLVNWDLESLVEE